MTINVLGGAGSATGSLTDGTPLALTVVTLPATADYKYNVFISLSIKVGITGGSSNAFEAIMLIPGSGAKRLVFSSVSTADIMNFGQSASGSDGVTAQDDDVSASEYISSAIAAGVSRKSNPIPAGPGAPIVVYLTAYKQAGTGTTPTASYYLNYSYVGVKVT